MLVKTSQIRTKPTHGPEDQRAIRPAGKTAAAAAAAAAEARAAAAQQFVERGDVGRADRESGAPRRGGSPHGPLPPAVVAGGGSPPPSLPLGPQGLWCR